MQDVFAPSPAVGTLVFGHRGSPRVAKENTFDSFDAAEAEGADGIELDVRMTSDGEAVVHHDADIVIGNRSVPISSVGLADLPDSVLTLRDVFMRYRGDLGYFVEIKQGPAPRPGLLEFRVAALISSFALASRSTVLSFSSETLRRIHELDPQIETCLNFDGSAHRPEGRLWPDLPRGARHIAPQLALTSPELFERAKAEGLSVHVWTVNEPDKARELAALGATSLITDVPGEIRKTLQG